MKQELDRRNVPMPQDMNVPYVPDDNKKESKPAPRRVKLDKEEAHKNRIATIKKDIPFTDYSVSPPEELIYEAEITPVNIDYKKVLLKRCTSMKRGGIPEIDWDLYSDMVTAKTFGFGEADWSEFKKNHPIGLETKMSMIANEVNGQGGLSEEDVEQLKNLVSQG